MCITTHGTLSDQAKLQLRSPVPVSVSPLLPLKTQEEMRVLQERVSQQSLSQQGPSSSSQVAYADTSSEDPRSHPTGAGTSLSSSGPRLGVPVAASSSSPPGTSSSVAVPSPPPPSDSRGVSGSGASALREAERLTHVQRGSTAAEEGRGKGEGAAAAARAGATGERGSIAERIARGMYGTMGFEGMSNLQLKQEEERERPQHHHHYQARQQQRPLGAEGSGGTSVQIARDAVGAARSGGVAGAGREGASMPVGVGGALNVGVGIGEIGGRGGKVVGSSQVAAPAHGGLKMVSYVDFRVERSINSSGRIRGGSSSFLIGSISRSLREMEKKNPLGICMSL